MYSVKVGTISIGGRVLILLPLLLVLSAGALLAGVWKGRRLAAGGGGDAGRLAALETMPFMKGGFAGTFTRLSEDVAPVCNISTR